MSTLDVIDSLKGDEKKVEIQVKNEQSIMEMLKRNNEAVSEWVESIKTIGITNNSSLLESNKVILDKLKEILDLLQFGYDQVQEEINKEIPEKAIISLENAAKITNIQKDKMIMYATTYNGITESIMKKGELFLTVDSLEEISLIHYFSNNEDIEKEEMKEFIIKQFKEKNEQKEEINYLKRKISI